MNQQGKNDYSVAYHIRPEFGLLNDPNGLVRFKNFYHVYYQLNPLGFNHKHKSWGHVYSEDMVHWKRADIALHPDAWFDKDGVYSGSAVEYQEKIYVFYTGNVIDQEGINRSYQCLAVSSDGFTFEKMGPIMEHPKGYTRHVRDPKVFKLDETVDWYMVLGAQAEGLQGDVLLYRSANLYDWELISSLGGSNQLDYGYMMECPNMIKVDGQWILLVSPQGMEKEKYLYQNIYQSGYFTCDITEDKEIILTSEFVELDHGFEFYAPQVFDDGVRSILYAWMGAMEPAKEASLPTIEHGQWSHNLTVPRELHFRDGKLTQQPWRKLTSLRDFKGGIQIHIDQQYEMSEFSLQAEILLEMQTSCSHLSIRCKDCFTFKADSDRQELSLERRNWLSGKPEVRVIKYEAEIKNIQVLCDNSTIEIFINNGETVFSSRFFSDMDERKVLEILCPNAVAELEYYPLAVD